MLYDKIELLKSSRIPYIKYVLNRKQNTPCVLISHGSGGLTEPTMMLADVALENNFNVIIPDHFSSRGVTSQWWHKYETNPSLNDRKEDIADICTQEHVVALSGISAGGSAAIMASGIVQIPSFAVYPSTYPITESMTHAVKTVVVAGENDNWTTLSHANALATINKNIEIEVLPGYHGFLSKNEDRYLEDTISLRNFNDTTIYPDDINPDRDYFDRGVTVKFNADSRLKTRILFDKFLKGL